MQSFSIGSDPEMMLVDNTGKHRSAIGVVLGNKESKVDLGNGCWAFPDNVLAECNIKPAYSKEEMVNNFRDCFTRYAKLVKPLTLIPQESHNYDASELKHPDAMAFGCSPDFCAYELVQNASPFCDPKSRFRTGGAHLHLGGNAYPFNDDMAKVYLIRLLDLFASIPAIFIDHDPTSLARRNLYGKAGSHRPTDYGGVEYRSLGNFWIKSPKMVEMMYDVCAFAIDMMANGSYKKVVETFDLYDPKDLCETINKTDRNKGKKYLKICEELMPKSLFKQIESFMPEQQFDFYQEWGISKA